MIVEHHSQHCDDDDSVANFATGLQRPDWNVNFLRRESHSGSECFTFVLPQVDEVSTVNEKSFCEKLRIPTGSETTRKKAT